MSASFLEKTALLAHKRPLTTNTPDEQLTNTPDEQQFVSSDNCWPVAKENFSSLTIDFHFLAVKEFVQRWSMPLPLHK